MSSAGTWDALLRPTGVVAPPTLFHQDVDTAPVGHQPRDGLIDGGAACDIRLEAKAASPEGAYFVGDRRGAEQFSVLRRRVEIDVDDRDVGPESRET